MTQKELIKEITEGHMNNKVFYICDFRKEYDKKPIRHVKPTRVMVRCNSEVDKRIYYSNSHFVPFSESTGKVLKKVIAVYDNTGYRSYTGVPLKVFDNLEDCQDYYNQQVDEYVQILENKKKNIINQLQNEIDEMNDLKG